MNFAIQSIAVAAITLCAAPQFTYAADLPESSASVTAAANVPVVQVAQADTSSWSPQTAVAMQSAGSESFDSGKRGARAAADQGPEALRRYVDRTRMIYELDIQQFKAS